MRSTAIPMMVSHALGMADMRDMMVDMAMGTECSAGLVSHCNALVCALVCI